MPPKRKYGRDEVIRAAVAVVEESGLQALTARAVAARLGSSTAPVYSQFATMEELTLAVVRETQRALLEYASRPYTDRVFLNMGTGIALEQGNTPVNQHDPAWINTFVHPDEDCPLGDAVSYPILRASLGVSDHVDVGAYWTTAPGANYGMVGGEVKYAFLQETETLPAAAVRASVAVLTGVPDFDITTYSLDLMTSKKIAMLTPYAGIRENYVVGTETTDKVDLDRERIFVPQGFVGVACSFWKLNLAVEYNVSTVNTLALSIGFGL